MDIPIGTNCAPLVTDLVLFCFETDLEMSLSGDRKAEIIKDFNSTSRYLDHLLNFDNSYFDSRSIIY